LIHRYKRQRAVF